MRSLGAFINEDTNQFGPGTDLIASILAVLLVVALVSAHLYRQEVTSRAEDDGDGGSFRLAAASFAAADFHAQPVTRLIDPANTQERVRQIVADYRRSNTEFAYIFVIGHSNELDDRNAADKSRAARLQRNWNYAFRRAAAIAALIEQHLSPEERERLVVMSTGEFDMRDPSHPNLQANAWVEVVFGRAWKPPSRLQWRE